MKKKLRLSGRYIKSYKKRSVSIVMSIALSIALIVGISILNATNENLELQDMKYKNGIYSANFEQLNKRQIEKLEENKSIEHLGLTSVYRQTSVEEKQNIEIVGANNDYILSNSMIEKGRLPQNKNEMVAEDWVLRNFGINPEVNQKIELKLYDENGDIEVEKFEIVGILSDKAMEKSAAKLQLFVPIDLENHTNIEASASFINGVDINKEIDKISKELGIEKKNIYLNTDMIDLEMSNNTVDFNDIKILTVMSFVCFIVIYGVFNISVYKRIKEYGILRSIGYDNFKLYKLILSELMSLYILAIPIGVMLGVIGAKVFNKIAGNINTEFVFNGNIVEIGMIYPVFLIISSIITIAFLIIFISFLIYRQVKKLSIVDSIKVNIESKGIKRNFVSVNFLRKYMKSYKAISLKNIFRNKKSFVMIILSMSICGIVYISLNYKLDIDMAVQKDGFKSQFMNADFMLDEFIADTTMTGISQNTFDKISKLNGVESIESSMVMPSRMVVDEEDIFNREYFKNMNDSASDMYYQALLDTDKNTGELILKNNIKGYNDAAIKKVNNYILSGNIDLEKMNKKNIAILYVPQIIGDNPLPQFNENGKSVLNVKVGDKIRVKFRKDRSVASDEYWIMEDIGEYEYEEFEIGAIVYYPYMNETSVIGYSTAEIIISEDRFKDIMGINAYTSLNINLKHESDDKAIEKNILDIASNDKDVITRNIIQEKKNVEAIHKKTVMYNLGITMIVIIIAMINIVNNVSYNITSRKNELGIFRAVGFNDGKVKKMIIFEGVLYGIISSFISIIVSFVVQKFIHTFSGVENIGIKFSVNYMDYLIIVIINLVIGYITTYSQADRLNRSSIVDCIRDVE